MFTHLLVRVLSLQGPKEGTENQAVKSLREITYLTLGGHLYPDKSGLLVASLTLFTTETGVAQPFAVLLLAEFLNTQDLSETDTQKVIGFFLSSVINSIQGFKSI